MISRNIKLNEANFLHDGNRAWVINPTKMLSIPTLFTLVLLRPLWNSRHYYTTERTYRRLIKEGIVSYGTLIHMSPNAQHLEFKFVSKDGQRITGIHKLAAPNPHVYAGDTVVVLHDNYHGVLL